MTINYIGIAEWLTMLHIIFFHKSLKNISIIKYLTMCLCMNYECIYNNLLYIACVLFDGAYLNDWIYAPQDPSPLISTFIINTY